MASVGDWMDVLERLYPAAWAEEWDNPGLQAGDRSWPVERVLVALDPTPEVVAEARERGSGLLVTHHPLVFRPLQRLDLRDPVTRTATDAVSGRVAVVACHTNADVAEGGVTDALAAALDLEVEGVLQATGAGARAKLVTFVPPEATAKVLDAVSEAGAGIIGEYTHCSFRVRGAGTFLPSEQAHPAVGDRGRLNEVEEDRLEVIVPRERVKAAVEALLAAHPYEEVAYDVYPVLGGGLGLGRVARPREPLTAEALAARCRERLRSEVRLAGDPEKDVATVALCGGSGGSLVPDAVRAGADAYVTGDLGHHRALDAAAADMAAIDAGHHGTEWPFVPALAERLRDAGGPLHADVLVSETRTDPFAAP